MGTYRDLPDHSRIWIYQSNRAFNREECAEIKDLAQHFLAGWNAHGSELHAAIELFYDLFLVVMLDEDVAKASGCSIDASFQFIKGLEKRLKVSLLDRLIVAHRDAKGIALSRVDEFESLIRHGEVGRETIVFNNLVDKKADFDSKWEVLLKDSWHRKLLD